MSGEVRMITARDNFHNQLERWVQINNSDAGASLARLDLIQACGAVWNDKGKMPELYRHDVRDAISNCADADQWEKKGRTYAGAAQRISPILKAMGTIG